MEAPTAPTSRIEWIDLARGLALLAMAIYHLAWDLEFFGYAEPGMTARGGWKLFARSIASSFLFLVGVSLFLAHGRGIRWRPFLRRIAMVAGAALAISIATYFATPDQFIFFGILHEIVLASLLGLAFLRLPAPLILVAAALVIAAPNFLRTPFFDHPAFWWVGLSSRNPPSNDYVPIFPWFGAVLIGIAAAKLAARAGVFRRLADTTPGGWSRPLQFAGRHSLAVYLVHQPVLIGLLWLFSQALPADEAGLEAQFLPACQEQCVTGGDADFCLRYCLCMLDRLEAEGLVEAVFSDTRSDETQDAVESMAARCNADAENQMGTGQ
jgi:uncharacterized membrane protein